MLAIGREGGAVARWWRAKVADTGFRPDSLRHGDIGEVATLLGQLDEWLRHHDPVFSSVRSSSTLREWVRDQFHDPLIRTVVVRDGRGEVRAYAATYPWDVAESSDLRGFYASRNGVVPIMALPLDAPYEIEAITRALVNGLAHEWQAMGTTGEIVTLPSCLVAAVPEIAVALRGAGVPDSFVLAHRPLGPLPPSPYPPPADVTVRRARPADQAAVTALHVEEVAFHEAYCSTVKVVPAIAESMRRQLTRVWSGASPSSDVPLVMVAERGGVVIGMTESYLQPGDRVDSWPIRSKRFGYLNSVGVRADQRGGGVGRMLVAATLDELVNLGAGAYTLYYLPANPLSSRFWTKLGFRPVLSRFQSRRNESAGAYAAARRC
jgi:ribosomal protein S18 acetylase RimI-like enzyme